MKKRVSFLVLALLIAISGCGKSESSLNGQDSSEEINANGTGEDEEQAKTGAGDAADKEADTADAKQNADTPGEEQVDQTKGTVDAENALAEYALHLNGSNLDGVSFEYTKTADGMWQRSSLDDSLFQVAGNLDFVLEVEGNDEFSQLCQDFEEMRKRLKESTEEKILMDKENKELISNISHDLKTPITAIKGYVEGIRDGVADTPEKMDKYIKTIYNKAIDMDRLINELTTYSGIDNNRIPYNFHRINVADYFGDCVEEVGLDLEQRGIKLNYSNLVSPDTVVIADPEQMKKVINNIISNSVKYMDKPDGHIDIRILDEVDSIRVEIEDNGKGIAQKDLQKIFERFYRTDASRNSAQGGSGIGLSIVKKIVEDHGGYVWATAKEGEGTCMHFVLRKYIELQPGGTK